jgi:hypothetical protein
MRLKNRCRHYETYQLGPHLPAPSTVLSGKASYKREQIAPDLVLKSPDSLYICSAVMREWGRPVTTTFLRLFLLCMVVPLCSPGVVLQLVGRRGRGRRQGPASLGRGGRERSRGPSMTRWRWRRWRNPFSPVGVALIFVFFFYSHPFQVSCNFILINPIISITDH